MKKQKLQLKSLRRVEYVALCLLLAFVYLIPAALLTGKANAAQMTTRSLTISSGVPSATGVIYTYGFTPGTAGAIQSIKFVACTTATATYGLGSTSSTTGCTAPTSMNINQGTQQGTNTFTTTTGFTRTTSTTGNCAPANNVLCVTRTQATSETIAGKILAWNTQTNPATTNTAFFVGIYTYSDTAYATNVDNGTVASAVVQTLTINAAVAEILNFCVGSTTTNDATTTPGADCTAIAGTSLNIGTLDPSSINISPVNVNGGDNKNGVAMLRTNSANGATVSYDAIQQSGTNHQGTLRISGASCNAGNVSTDQCIDAQGGTQGVLTAGTEKFGMTVAGTNCGSTTSYSCTYTSGTEHLVPSTNYVGKGTTGTPSTYTYCTSCNTADSGNGYAWVEGGTATQIASASSGNPVDDEALILKFASTPSITTPFGSYTAQADFIAVPTY